ncbi:hypothetical protein [Arcicella rosea]|uniref:Uncharacterized protein n=1 Tax=Arcicella rosea TaxID=502909 RepID=A0A841EED2_9BACT|nr:hypothetical protein [Arcicella rosea]MBB6002517.1 hypothetical protein [Arcicella rosea]
MKLQTATKKNSMVKNTWVEELENRNYRKNLQILQLSPQRKFMQ